MFSSKIRNILRFIYLVLMVSHHGQCYNVTKLPCQAQLEPGLMYMKISWYKVKEGFTGLVLKNLRTNQTVLYKSANHSYHVGEDLSLILPTSAVNDCGTYHCTLWPPVGHKIQEGEWRYYPQGCLESPEAQLTKVQSRRLSSSSLWDNMAYKVTAGIVVVVLLLTVLTVGIWKCNTRQPEKYSSLVV